MTLNWFIFDGIPKWLLVKLIESGELPMFEKIINNGNFSSVKPSYPNCQTPTAMATLLTGQSQQKHKINGFWMQGKEDHTKHVNSLLETRPEGNLIWEEFYKDNIVIDLIQTPWYKGESKKNHFLGGINNRIARDKYFELTDKKELKIDDVVGHIKAIKKDEFIWKLESKGNHKCISFKKWSSFTSNNGYSAWYRLVKSMTGKIHLIRTPVWETEYSSNRSNMDLLTKKIEGSPYINDSLRSMYRKGIFGKQFYLDGDGTAEDIFMELYKLSFEYYKLVLNEFIEYNDDANKLRIIYVPFTDGIGHELIGFINSDREIQKKYKDKAIELLLKVYGYADKLLSIAYEKEKESQLIISSDHGMNGVNIMFHPNDVLILNEYASYSRNDLGNVSLQKSQVIYHIANNGYIYDNTCNNDNSLFKEALAKLIEYKHPITNKKMIKELVDIKGNIVDLKTFDDNKCYLVFSEYVMSNADPTKELEVFSKPNRSATHHNYNSDKLNGVFISSFKISEEKLKSLNSNEQVKSIILEKMRDKKCQ